MGLDTLDYFLFDPLTLTLTYGTTTDIVPGDEPDGRGAYIELATTYALVGCRLIDIVRGEDGLMAYVDDEGLFTEPCILSNVGPQLIGSPHTMLAGRLLIVVDDNLGGNRRFTDHERQLVRRRAQDLGLSIIDPPT